MLQLRLSNVLKIHIDSISFPYFLLLVSKKIHKGFLKRMFQKALYLLRSLSIIYINRNFLFQKSRQFGTICSAVSEQKVPNGMSHLNLELFVPKMYSIFWNFLFHFFFNFFRSSTFIKLIMIFSILNQIFIFY